MAGHSGPWTPGKSRTLKAWRFAGLVVAVAALAFYLTLNWPLSDPVRHNKAFEAEVDVPSGTIARGNLTCIVASVTDGDTLRCRDGTRVRLHAIAARERDGSCSAGHPCPSATAQAATSELRRLAAGRTLRCQSTGESYDRITAICWTPEGEEINCAMVRSGVALIWDRFNRESPLCRT